MLNSLPKLCFSTSLRSDRTQKTGLAQHADHKDLEFKHEQTFPHQLSPQNDCAKQKREKKQKIKKERERKLNLTYSVVT